MCARLLAAEHVRRLDLALGEAVDLEHLVDEEPDQLAVRGVDEQDARLARRSGASREAEAAAQIDDGDELPAHADDADHVAAARAAPR